MDALVADITHRANDLRGAMTRTSPRRVKWSALCSPMEGWCVPLAHKAMRFTHLARRAPH
jgi:hypothetical protein